MCQQSSVCNTNTEKIINKKWQIKKISVLNAYKQKWCSPEEVTIATVGCFMFSIRIHMRQYAKHTLLIDYL